MESRIVLHTGRDRGDESYLPELWLDHAGADGSELYVIVGEEAAGMAEGVPFEVYEELRERLERLGRLEKILGAIGKDGGSVVIRFEQRPNGPGQVRPDWSLMSVFGSEAEDSPMAGGSHIGSGDTLGECLASAVK